MDTVGTTLGRALDDCTAIARSAELRVALVVILALRATHGNAGDGGGAAADVEACNAPLGAPAGSAVGPAVRGAARWRCGNVRGGGDGDGWSSCETEPDRVASRVLRVIWTLSGSPCKSDALGGDVGESGDLSALVHAEGKSLGLPMCRCLSGCSSTTSRWCRFLLMSDGPSSSSGIVSNLRGL